MRRYNYFDDDDERLDALRPPLTETLKTGIVKAAELAKDTVSGIAAAIAETRRKKKAEKRAASSEQPKAAVQAKTSPAEEKEPSLAPPKPSAGTYDFSDIIDAPQYEKPVLPQVTVPSLDTAALTARKEPAPAHTITEAKTMVAEPDTADDEVSDAIRAFSHKSGDRVDRVARIKRVAETVIDSSPIEVIERVSRGRKFVITLGMLLFTVLFFVGVVFFFMRSINAENDRIAQFNTNAGEVCADYIMRYGSANYENLYNTYGVQGFRLTGLCFVRELDFDGDGNSELLLSYLNNGEYYNDVWGYNSSGEFEVLFSDKAAQSEDKSQDAWTTLYYKNNRYMIAVHDPEDITQVTMYQLKNKKFSEGFTCTYDEVSEAYVVNDEQDLISFERIKLSVLRAEKAIVSADAVMDTLDNFSGTESVLGDPGAPQTLEASYYAIVQEYNKRYGTASYVEKNGKAYVDGLAVVNLIDFDGDGQDELLLVYRKQVKTRDEDNSGASVTTTTDKYYCDIYRYSGTRALLAYTNEGLSNSQEKEDDVYFMTKLDGGSYHYCINTYISSDYGNELSATSGEMEFNGTEFTSCMNISYEDSYGYSEYYVEGDSVKKAVFEEMAEDIPLFYGNGDNVNKIIYKVTYVQRKASDAGEMSGIPAETEKAIQQLNAQYEAN